ncbi:hypothetical protein PL263_02015 [Methylomonas sp. EFPC3]|uniref:hypothetical protein n=1 Tax=Methylomonas sp. EFPC3 TaxID=3021710 RepID=UPI00241775F4|nr:hypothetical protein [Methylomonas sp. EFPC3]WFP50812.1 hypothetical protein PL263_02015 [Methylomonas sp. EFPC3]
MAKTLYQLLNLPETATAQQIHSAFKTVERLYTGRHDDASLASLARAREAFLILSDAQRRLAYDRKLAMAQVAADSVIAPAERHRPFQLAPRQIMVAALLAVAAGLWLYRDYQKTERLAAAAESLLRQQEWLAQQSRGDRQQAQIEAERSLRQQQLEDANRLAERQLANQQRALELLQSQADTQSELKQQDIANSSLEMQYRKPELALELRQQKQEYAAAQRERALHQHDENIASINSLRAARIRAYDREHTTGEISRSNPALDP